MPGQDKVLVKNLQLPFGITAPDVWGKPKEQPALISVTLTLRTGFDTAAQQDALDNSTIHYGQLAKRIRASCAGGQDVETIISNAEGVVADMGMKAKGNFIIAHASIELCLMKASMFGDGVTVNSDLSYDGRGMIMQRQRVFAIQDVTTMTLIGVNVYEREGKQPVVASIWIYMKPGDQAEKSLHGQTVALFGLEHRLLQIIQETSYETLESLANYTVEQLQESLLDESTPGAQVRLRLEKPRAIAFADAPAVEVFREISGGGQATSVAGASNSARLNIIKPYGR